MNFYQHGSGGNFKGYNNNNNYNVKGSAGLSSLDQSQYFVPQEEKMRQPNFQQKVESLFDGPHGKPQQSLLQQAHKIIDKCTQSQNTRSNNSTHTKDEDEEYEFDLSLDGDFFQELWKEENMFQMSEEEPASKKKNSSVKVAAE